MAKDTRTELNELIDRCEEMQRAQKASKPEFNGFFKTAQLSLKKTKDVTEGFKSDLKAAARAAGA